MKNDIDIASEITNDITNDIINYLHKQCSKPKNKKKIQNIINFIISHLFFNIQPFFYTILGILLVIFFLNCFQFYYYIRNVRI